MTGSTYSPLREQIGENLRHHFVARTSVGQRFVSVMLLSLLVLVAGCSGNPPPAPRPAPPLNPAASSVPTDASEANDASEVDVPSAAPAENPTPENPTPENPTPEGPDSAAPESPAVDVTAVLQNNPLYGAAALVGAGCGADSAVPLDSLDNVRTYYASVLSCLDAAWMQVGAAGIDVRPADLEVFSGPSIGSCLEGVEYSFYCPSNETIYMYADEIIKPWLEFPADYGRGLTRLSATHVIAHEYGHHVQQFTGIFGAAGPNFSGTELEPRLELQASCFADVFLASQSDSYPIAAEYLAEADLWRYITRIPNHGSEANQALWTERGFQAAAPGGCNTFSAAPEEVA